MKKILVTVLAVGLLAVVAQAASVVYNFNETSPGVWEVSVLVTPAASDSDGLSTYALRVYGYTGGVSYVESTLGTIAAGYTPIGMQGPTNQQVDDFWNIGNKQEGNFIAGIGQYVVDEPGFDPPGTPHVDLGVPALLGTLTIPGLTYDNYSGEFVHGGTALLRAARADGEGDFLADGTYDVTVTVTPEPMTLSLLAIGGCLVAIKRKKS